MKLKKYGLHAFCLFLLVLFCLFRFQEAVFQNVLSAPISPDGYGSVGGFQMMIDQAKESPQILFSDVYHSTKMGLGILEPGPFSIFWKLYLFIFGSFVGSLQIVILSTFVIALLNGLFFYFFSFHFLKSHWMSLIGGVFAICFYNYHYRANGHLFGLGSMFLPVLLVALLLKMTQTKDLLSFLWLAIVTAVNFNVNEYYGFFGLWVTAIVLIYIFVQDFFDENFKWKQTCVFLAAFGISTLSLFLVFYPNQIAMKIINFITRIDSNYVKGITHELSTMVFYSSDHLSDFFVVNKHFAAPHQKSFYQNTELTFSIGFFVSVFVVINFLLLYKYLSSKQKRIIYSSFLIVLTSFLLCLNPFKFPSLVGINAIIAPMFRVTFRALVYFDISMTFVFLYTTYLLFKSARAKVSKTFIYACLSLIIVSIDLPYPHILEKVSSQSFPDAKELSLLANEDSSFKVIDLPMFPTSDSMPERSYIYSFEYAFHRKRVLNFPFAQGNNFKFAAMADQFAKEVNTFKEDMPLFLNKLGVKYVIYHKTYFGRIMSFEDAQREALRLSTNKYLSTVMDNDRFTVFKIQDGLPDFNSLNFVMDILTPKNQFFDFSASCIQVADSMAFNCNKKSKARFISYYDSPKKVSAKFEIEIGNEHLLRDIQFVAQPMETVELILRDLVGGRRENTKVQVAGVRIENVD